MEEIFICGHKNPDSDSVCSAFALAALRNACSDGAEYRPLRCGSLNPQTRFIFDCLKVTPPELKSDIFPQTEDVMEKDPFILDLNAPIYDAIEVMCGEGRRFIPLTKEGKYQGYIGFFEIGQFLLQGGRNDYHFYTLNIENLEKVLKARILNKGRERKFKAVFLFGGMAIERSKEVIASMDPDKTILIVGDRVKLISEAIEAHFCGIIITGRRKNEELIAQVDFSSYDGWVLSTPFHSEETLRKAAFSVPVSELMTCDRESLSIESPLEEAAKHLKKSIAAPVVDSNLQVIGLVTQRHVLDYKPRKLILVDHNELNQAVNGAELCEIIEVVDHHRLAPAATRTPISFYARPVGSTCTLVYELFAHQDVVIPQTVARVLLAGIVSDTIILKSPTTTDFDRKAVKNLAEIAGFDYESFGREIFTKGRLTSNRDSMEMITTDFKEYEEGNIRVGIGQIEVTSLNELSEIEAELLEKLPDINEERKLHWSMMLISDIITADSILLTSGYSPAEMHFGFTRLTKGKYHLPGVLSRKKQLLPAVIEALEAMQKE